MKLTHEGAAVLSDRDKGIACACRELGINERKCAVHIHANFFLAGIFTQRCRPFYLPLSLSPYFHPFPFFPFALFPLIPFPLCLYVLLPFSPFSLYPSCRLALLPHHPLSFFPTFLLSFFPYCPLSSSVLAGFFNGPKKDSRGPFVEFVKAHNEEQSQYLLLQLRAHHVRPEKWEAFLEAYNAVEPWVSVLSAIEKGSYSLPACLSKNHRIYLHPCRSLGVCLPTSLS